MYTILINDDNTMIATQVQRIMQRSKLVDDLHFLVDQMYNDLPMEDFTATLEYILPVSKEYKTETLVLSEDLYKGKLEYKLPLDTHFTKEAGSVEIQLTFTYVDIDDEGNDIQRVRKISSAVVEIVPLSAWFEIIPDEALSAIDQRIIKQDAQIKAMTDLLNSILDD